MWVALFAINISVLLQAVTGIDDHGCRHGPRLRAEPICIPARRNSPRQVNYHLAVTAWLPALQVLACICEELLNPDTHTSNQGLRNRPPERTREHRHAKHC